jgi:hypothetical protein
MNYEMWTPYAGHAEILLLMKGKLIIGKVKSSRLDTHDGPTHRDLQQVAKWEMVGVI